MYLPITGDDLFYKHRDGCGDVRNHYTVVGVTITEEIYEDGSEEPVLYICDIDMIWHGRDGTYTFPECELKDPDDWDTASEWIASQVA